MNGKLLKSAALVTAGLVIAGAAYAMTANAPTEVTLPPETASASETGPGNEPLETTFSPAEPTAEEKWAADYTSIFLAHQEAIKAGLEKDQYFTINPAVYGPNADPFADYSETITNGCHVDFPDTVQPECKAGDVNGSRQVIVFGDSHAGHWFPAFENYGETNDVLVRNWTKAGCPVADFTVVSEYIGDQPYVACDTWRNSTIDAIIGLEPDMVVVSQSDLIPHEQLTHEDWANRTVTSLKRLTDADIPVLFVLDVPTNKPFAFECLRQNVNQVQNCTYNASEKEPYPGRKAVVRGQVSSQLPQVQILDPLTWMCFSDRCPAVVNESLMVRDEAHVSLTAARGMSALAGILAEGIMEEYELNVPVAKDF